MYLQIIKKSLFLRKKRVMVAIFAVLMGASLAAALINIYLNINDKVGKELRNYGANIQVLPKTNILPVEVNGIDYGNPEKSATIKESDLFKLKKIFWKYNILGFTPYLKAPVEIKGGGKVVLVGTWFSKKVDIPGEKFKDFTTGIKQIAPWWKVNGQWVTDDEKNNGAILGTSVAGKMNIKPGDFFQISYQGKKYTFKAKGVVTTGGQEDDQIFANLAQVQNILNLPDRVSQIQVSALTKPDDKLALKYKANPKSLNGDEYIKWYCSPYIDAITFQINEVFPDAIAKPIPQIAQAEGSFLGKVQLLMMLITIIALVAASLGVMSTMTANILERRKEIGMVKAIGAQNTQIVLLFVGELGLIGFLGGGLGYLLGIMFAKIIGTRVFETVITPDIIVLPITILIALSVVLAGSVIPVKQALQIDPSVVLRGD